MVLATADFIAERGIADVAWIRAWGGQPNPASWAIGTSAPLRPWKRRRGKAYAELALPIPWRNSMWWN